MFKCPKCDRTYSHQSGLSRHLHGNPKQRAKACQGRSDEPIALQDHILDGKQPEAVEETTGILNNVRDIKDLPAAWLKAVHLNPAYPHLWNVVMANVSTKRMHVYQNGEWIYMSFKSWSEEFMKHTLLIYWEEKGPREDKGDDVRIVLFDHRKDVEESLEAALIGPMRRTIKRYHKLA